MTDRSQSLARTPISRPNTYELVADEVLTLIRSGSLAPGAAVPTERELAQAYAVGRSSVREGLRMLESQGVIRAESKGSFAVADVMNPLNNSLELEIGRASCRERV